MPAQPGKARKAPTAEARLLGLASWIIAQGEPVTRSRIYAQFKRHYGGSAAAKEKKFGRDKQDLERLGFVLLGEPLGTGQEEQYGYRIDARASSLRGVDLTPDEAAVVWTAGVSALRLSDHPLRDELENALRKLAMATRALPPRASDPADLGGDGTRPDGGKTLEKLVRAWERRKRVRLEYYRVTSDELTVRDVDLYGWARRRGEYILVGHCHLRGALRLFYLSRVQAVSPNTKRPGAPDYVIPEDFDIRTWTRQEIWDYRVHAPVAAAVRVSGSLVKLAPQLFPDDVPLEREESGARVARLQVRNLRGLVRQALAWGPEAEVLEPPEARALARELLDGLAAELGRTP